MEPRLFEPVVNPYLVGFAGKFSLDTQSTEPSTNPGKAKNQEALAESVERLAALQAKLFATNRYSVLLIFQAMDAAGKDGAIRALLSGVNPQGCQVTSFKAPNDEELDHDFLWRVQRSLPERGRIGVFNRSHYEEVLVVRVNPGFLDGQRLPQPVAGGDSDWFWNARFASIRDAERHWSLSGTVILKFFLNVSQREQHARFVERIDNPEARWKFRPGDFVESKKWDAYMDAYQDALAATSRPWAPWYCIPADSKSYARRVVAGIVVETIAQLSLRSPQPTDAEVAEMVAIRKQLT